VPGVGASLLRALALAVSVALVVVLPARVVAVAVFAVAVAVPVPMVLVAVAVAIAIAVVLVAVAMRVTVLLVVGLLLAAARRLRLPVILVTVAALVGRALVAGRTVPPVFASRRGRSRAAVARRLAGTRATLGGSGRRTSCCGRLGERRDASGRSRDGRLRLGLFGARILRAQRRRGHRGNLCGPGRRGGDGDRPRQRVEEKRRRQDEGDRGPDGEQAEHGCGYARKTTPHDYPIGAAAPGLNPNRVNRTVSPPDRGFVATSVRSSAPGKSSRPGPRRGPLRASGRCC
jgi:hypothetical protein